MSGARFRLPDSIAKLTHSQMELAIYEARLDRLGEDIARLYFIEKQAQMDVAEQAGCTRCTVGRRLPAIVAQIEDTAGRLGITDTKVIHN